MKHKLNYLFLIQGFLTLAIAKYSSASLFLTILGITITASVLMNRLLGSEGKYLEEMKLLSFASILFCVFSFLLGLKSTNIVYYQPLLVLAIVTIPVLSYFVKKTNYLNFFFVLTLALTFVFSFKTSKSNLEFVLTALSFALTIISVYFLNKKRIILQEKNQESKERLVGLIDSFPDTLILYEKDNFKTLNRSSFKIDDKFSYELKKFLIKSKNINEIFTYSSSDKFYEVKRLESEKFKNLLYLTDVTTVKNNELEIEKNRKQLANSSKLAALGEMAGGVAHEINNPLQILGLSIEQMRLLNISKVFNPSEYDKLCDQMESTVDRVTNIVKGMKLISRDGKQDPFEKLDAREVVHETLSFCKEKFKNAGVKIFYFEESIDEYCIAGQKVRLSQVLLNLLNNSYDALSKSKDKKIRIGVDSNEKNIRISVSDNGPGVPDDVVDKIFQPFFTTKEIGKGTGLGLSISKGIIDQHQGIFYLSENHRSTFVIEIPKYKAEVKK